MHTRAFLCTISVLLFCLLQLGCGGADPSAPPEIRLGDTVCTECGMIVSDERFATATVVNGDRGQTALIFDDFNCQRNFEAKHPEFEVVTRWSRDYTTMDWFHTDEGWFVNAAAIMTPMASHIAAFKMEHSAAAFSESLGPNADPVVCRWQELGHE